jgi:dipeptidase
MIDYGQKTHRKREVNMQRWMSVIAISLAVILEGGFQARAEHLSDGGCYSIVVGRDASATGSVIMAHNEDDYIPQIVNHRKVARGAFPPGTMVQVDSSLTMEQVPETWALLWSEMPEMPYSDSYLNERGVCVCSDACPSREDRPSLTGPGISRMLRRLVAERATSAREGVHLAGQLVERFGYAGSGRTYIICDPREGWLFCAVNGRHWVARRVPDGQVALVANTYTVQDIDLSDTINYLGSTDIVDYAVTRGWYDPKIDGAFNFARAYADPNAAGNPSNISRQWDGLRRVASVPPEHDEPLPFSVTPRNKMDTKAIMAVLRSHYEDTPLYDVDSLTGCPHGNSISTICNSETQTSFIAELRGDLPAEIGLVYWVCLSSPCASCYVPFYFGEPAFPDVYAGESVTPSEEEYRSKVERPFTVDTRSAYWTFSSFRYNVEKRYRSISTEVRRALDAVESRALAYRGDRERQAMQLWTRDQEAVRKSLSGFSSAAYQNALIALRGIPFDH